MGTSIVGLGARVYSLHRKDKMSKSGKARQLIRGAVKHVLYNIVAAYNKQE